MDALQIDLSRAPLGGTLVAGGATFRVFAPRASAVHVSGDFNSWKQDEASRLSPIGGGHWAVFVPGLKDGDPYCFFVDGPAGGTSGFKRDPHARLLTREPPFPQSHSVLRDPAAFPWHRREFTPPPFNQLVIYQLHVGTYDIKPGNPDGCFFDIIARVPYLASLGVNALELLPVQEFPTSFSMGYNGTDLFSPETQYGEAEEAKLAAYVAQTNDILHGVGERPYAGVDVLRHCDDQLRALVDVCHVHGIAVIFDVVYNHAGGGFDDHSLWFFDRARPGNNNDSLYFTNDGWAGGLVFAYWNRDVRRYLVDNALSFYREYHLGGLRFDEVSVMDQFGGWGTCQEITDALRAEKPLAIQIAEYWPVNAWVLKKPAEGGAGFDATWDDRLRESVRGAIRSAAAGASAKLSMQAIADAIADQGLGERWRAVQHVENHDKVYVGREPRVAKLADGSNSRSWYARSRSRFAMGLVLTSPGIPMLFMGQEILEDKPWSDTPAVDTTIFWAGLDHGDKAMVDFLRYTRDLITLRKAHPALTSEGCAVVHVHDDNRVLAFHRWTDNGDDLMIVCSLNETTWRDYAIGFPAAGEWREIFNSDVYDNWVNPNVAGNDGGVVADGPAMHGQPASARLTIPANGLLVFARG
ncbi:MAG: alpha amylase C-terminal domain-containing protein [Bradyrhizobium sp.]|uniref:alpha amylase C-terminal domain-containing protein n=1 Tax=Bradyrhizobium sp. TaxID=376 RepID=UPI001DBC7E4D|nr:alpha amylase C-terminal domain-containing protein [Bradyrhizobium sp.]MBV9561641.1 alpha amylase C-terminal domain-containing protein [Bradyrhizobium sp.]